MVQSIKNILFASDLSVDMKAVFDQAATLAIGMDANIVVLHVMEENPGSEKRIQMAFGEALYNNIKTRHKQRARDILIGKNVDAVRIRQAIAGFFKKNDQDKFEPDDNALIAKILVAEGRSIADEIIATATEEDCNIIVMGCKQQGLIADAMGNNVVRKVLKRSDIPVLVVPFSEK